MGNGDIGAVRDLRPTQAGELTDLLAHGLGADPEPPQRLGGRALSGGDQAEQELLGARLAEAEPVSFHPGGDHNLAGVTGEREEPGGRGDDTSLASGADGVREAEEPGGPGAQRWHGCFRSGWGGKCRRG